MTELLSVGDVRELSELPTVGSEELTDFHADPVGKLPAELNSSSYCM